MKCIPFNVGEVNCCLTLLCQMVGNMVAFIAATNEVMAKPFSKSSFDSSDVNNFILDVIYGKIITGMTVTMIFGSTYYSWMCLRMMRRKDTDDAPRKTCEVK